MSAQGPTLHEGLCGAHSRHCWGVKHFWGVCTLQTEFVSWVSVNKFLFWNNLRFTEGCTRGTECVWVFTWASGHQRRGTARPGCRDTSARV